MSFQQQKEGTRVQVLERKQKSDQFSEIMRPII